MRPLVWTLPLALAVAAIAFAAAQYEMEDSRQRAFMMKACVEAGGSWLLKWNNLPYCERPRTKAREE